MGRRCLIDMRVLFIAGADQQYGTFQMSKSMLKAVRRQDEGIEYVVITQKHGPLNDWCDINGFENYVYPYRYCVYYPPKNGFLGWIKLITKRVLVTVNNRIALYRIEKSGLLNGIDIIHTNINRDLFGVLLSKKHSIPNVTHLREYSRAHFGLKPLYHKQIVLMNNYSKRFIAISKAVKDDWCAYGLNNKMISVIYDGISTSEYCYRDKMIRNDGPMKIIMCGAIYEGKGQRELLDSVIELMHEGLDIQLDFYGDAANTDYSNQLRSIVEDNNKQDKIHFMGYKDNLKDIMCEYNVGVVCSKAEGFGLVTVEYLLSGLLVIASNTGASPELLDFGRYGLLYTLGDRESLNNQIRKAYSVYNQSVFKTENQRKYAEERFTIDNTALQICRLYETVIKDGDSSKPNESLSCDGGLL